MDAMAIAMDQARAAAKRGEVPVGAALLSARGELLACAGNQVEAEQDPSAHAEMIVMRAAAHRLGSPRLTGCTLAVTLEPCPMCAAATVHFRIARLIFGAYDPKGGGVDHGPRIFESAGCLHRPSVVGGVEELESAELLKAFFRGLRGA